MKVSHIIGSVLDTVVKIIIIVVIVTYTYKYALEAYEFGYRVFAEQPVSSPEAAKTISIYIPDDATVMEVGEVLEEKGLIKDARLFFVQEFLSGHHGEIGEGTYELSSAMTPEEMIKILTAKPAEEEDTDTKENAGGSSEGADEDNGDAKEPQDEAGDGSEETEGGETAEEGQA